MHSLDLLGDVGMMLAANMQWPQQYKMQVATEGGFLRAYKAFGILNTAGLFVGDLSVMTCLSLPTTSSSS